MAPATTITNVLLLSCLILFVTSTSTSALVGHRGHQQQKQKEFDYFAFALQWPGTYCQKTHHCCPSNGCCSRSVPKSEFTIHGLWPDYNDGSWPSCCSQSSQSYFDIKKISSLLGELQKYWPSLSCSSSSNCHGGKGLFWAHEWEKHGTCSSPIITGEYHYFSTVLDLYHKYNITKTLLDSGFVPSNDKQYLLGDVVAAVQNAFGASPLLVCSHGAVEELRICFYKDFKPRDCLLTTDIVDEALHSSSSCPQYISLPKLTHPAKIVTWSPDDEYMQTIVGLSDL